MRSRIMSGGVAATILVVGIGIVIGTGTLAADKSESGAALAGFLSSGRNSCLAAA